MKRVGLLVLAVAGLLAAGCEIPVDNQDWRCSTVDDCGSGWQCDPGSRKCVQAYDGVNGVFDDRLVFGLTLPLSDAAPGLSAISKQALGGLQAYLDHINSTGGIHGRKLEMIVVDDSFIPEKTASNIKEFIGANDGPRKVFLVGPTLGTPTSVAAADVAQEEKVLLWSPGTGIGALEPDPPNRYIFNYRARFSDEAEQITTYLRTIEEPNTPAENIALFAQGFDDKGTVDGPGADTVQGVGSALGIAPSEVVVATYEINTTRVTEPVRRLLKWMASPDRVVTGNKRHIGLVLGAVWDVGAAFILTMLNQLSAARTGQQLDSAFRADLDEDEVARLATVEPRMVAYSGIAIAILKAAFGSATYPWTDDEGKQIQKRYGAGLVVSQTVPYVESGSTGVRRYREHLATYQPDAPVGEFSLEVYLNMWLLGEALQAHGRDLTTESFIETLQTFTADLGIGTELGYSIGSHQATSRVWALRLNETLEAEPVGSGTLLSE